MSIDPSTYGDDGKDVTMACAIGVTDAHKHIRYYRTRRSHCAFGEMVKNGFIKMVRACKHVWLL